ncbi:MAG: class I SAM-dependent methyltransferase [Candidatus Poseidoniales archaeon]
MTDTKRKHRHGIYKLYAPIYDRFMAPSFADGHSKMYKPLDLKSGDYILEVGVGTGISLKNVPEFVKVEAIDYSEPMLVKARKRQENGEFPAEINFQQMDAHVLEFEENQFDHTVVAHTLAVVAEPEVVIREIMRVTKPSGLIVIVNHYKDKKGILGTIWNPFRKRLGLGKHVDFKSLITKCGLDLVSEERVNRFTTHSRMLVCKCP